MDVQPGRSSGQARRRNAFACETCRSRRTKCDGRRPRCSGCERLESECIYHEAPETPPSRLELEITTIRERLDSIESLLTAPHGPEGAPPGVFARSKTPNSVLLVRDFPFMTIKTQATLDAFRLPSDLATRLLAMERNGAINTAALGTSRLFVLQQQRALSALAAFAEKCHIWYPMLHPAFTDQFSRIINGTFAPSSDTCLALVVTAIGVFVDNLSTATAISERHDAVFIEAALAMLPIIINESSIRSLQCIVLLSFYYACLVKPCQAHDYALIASSKVQNLLKSKIYVEDADTMELVRRAYWSILLIESELHVQLDLPESGIWRLDDDMSLPSGHETWNFARDAASPADTGTSPHSAISIGSTLDEMLTYFLAEISMRRMLQRCTTSVSNASDGRLVYAPIIAAELEHQLDEWYGYLPSHLRFDRNLSEMQTRNLNPPSQFLRIQYMACKASIYWPAAYQALISEEDVAQLAPFCSKFFDSYASFIAGAELVIPQCPPNVWTTCAR